MSRSLAVKAAVVGTLVFGALVAPTSSAQAQDGILNFDGSVNLYNEPGSEGANLYVDFVTLMGAGGTSNGEIRAGSANTGVFAGVAPGTVGEITDLSISATGVNGTPVNPFVTIGGYTFTLDTAPMADGFGFGPISLGTSPGGTGTTATFGLFGTVTGGSLGATSRTFVGVFTTQFPGQSPIDVFNAIDVRDETFTKTFSATFVLQDAAVVPEPSTYLLLGTGLGALGLVGLRRRRSEG